jgi:hypothetical protein
VFALFVAGCSTSLKGHGTLFTRLKNRGPVALSSENPFLAANLLLTREMEVSPELKGFIEHRGMPAALEVKHETLGPLTMELHYPGERQTYHLEEGDGTWLISNPSSMNPDTYKRVAAVAAFQNGFVQPPTPDSPAGVVEQRSALASVPSSSQGTGEGFVSPAPSTAGQNSPPTSGPIAGGHDDARIVSDLIQGRERERAELTPRGDVVHYVTFPGETLVAIARWYTFDAANKGKIQRINGLKENQELSLGDTVVVPAYLLKNKIRMTEEASVRLGRP